MGALETPAVLLGACVALAVVAFTPFIVTWAIVQLVGFWGWAILVPAFLGWWYILLSI